MGPVSRAPARLARGPPPRVPSWRGRRRRAEVDAYRRLRRDAVRRRAGPVRRGTDRDDARRRPAHGRARRPGRRRAVVGGVRLAPVGERDIGWWTGSRLVVAPRRAGRRRASGPALVARPRRAASPSSSACSASTRPCRRARRCSSGGSAGSRPARRGRRRRRPPCGCAGRSTGTSGSSTRRRRASRPCSSRTPPGRRRPTARSAAPGWVGDDGAPVPGTDLVAACDAILPSMVERDPEWAGWCGVLVNVNDLSAMGADAGRPARRGRGPRRRLRRDACSRGCAAAPRPGACRCSAATRRSACPAALSVTALGRTDAARCRAAAAGTATPSASRST